MRNVEMPDLTEEDAFDRIVGWLSGTLAGRGRHHRHTEGSWPCDVDLRDVIRECLSEVQAEMQVEMQRASSSPRGMTTWRMDADQPGARVFYDAAWTLCRMGVLRPALAYVREPAGPPALSAVRYAVTPSGRSWLAEAGGAEALPSEPGRFAQILASHADRFGAGYHTRSQEAVRCHRAHAYLACCAMCGAAAESILIALAIAQRGDEEAVLREYSSATGRSKIERALMAQQNGHVQRELPRFTELLKYWRDAAAHGMRSAIAEGEAYTSLLLLLRFAQFAEESWEEITARTRHIPTSA